MVRVEVSERVAHELRAWIRRTNPDGGLLIQPGPANEQYQGPEWTAEDELLAPKQRWVLMPVGIDSIRELPVVAPESIRVVDADGFKVMIFFPPANGVLRVDVIDDAIRVSESAA
jgi:hypothetical protein